MYHDFSTVLTCPEIGHFPKAKYAYFPNKELKFQMEIILCCFALKKPLSKKKNIKL